MGESTPKPRGKKNNPALQREECPVYIPKTHHLRDIAEYRNNLLITGSPTHEELARHFGLTVDGTLRDMDGKPTYVPIDNSTQEAFWLLTGLPTIRQQEASAAVGMMMAGSAEDAATVREFTDRIAEAWVNYDQETGDIAAVYDAILDAQKLGFRIDDASVNRRRDAIFQEREITLRQRQPRRSRQ